MSWFLFGVRSTPVLPQWHLKDPGHSAKKCRWQVTPRHSYTLDPMKSEWADYSCPGIASVGTSQGIELTRSSTETARLQSSQLAEPLWIDPGVKSGVSVRKLHSTKKKKKKAQAGNVYSDILPKSSQAKKKAPISKLQVP